LKNQLTAKSVANAVRFSRAGKPQTSALLLEGGTDLRCFRNLIDSGKCEMYVVDGKEEVLKALADLEASRTPGVVAVVDADTDHLDGTLSPGANVITTETRDFEGILIRSPALEKVLNEHGIPIEGLAVRERALAAASPLGYLRWLTKRKDWTIDFKPINFGAFIDGYRISCDAAAMIREVLRVNTRFGLNVVELHGEVAALIDRRHDPWQVASGHDLAKIIAIALTNNTSRSFSPKDVESDLRLAFEMVFFTNTGLHISFCAWQRRNEPFIVLRIGCPDQD
jgi:hypothetical protein